MGKLRTILAATAAAAGVTASAIGSPYAPGLAAAAAVAPPPQSRAIRLDPAQRRMFDDPAKVVVVNWHRQKGKDYTASAKAVKSALRTGQDWFVVSLTQRQADATFAKCKNVAKKLVGAMRELLKLVGEAEEGPGFISEQYDKELKQAFVFNARELRLPNGARVIALPGRDPDALAGLTGNVIFTEFGLFPRGGRDHWRVVMPITTRGFVVVVISTPRGKDTKFYELWLNDEGDPEISVHTCDIWQSVEEGFSPDGPGGVEWTRADVEALRKRYKDAAGWLREYECKFSGDATALVSWSELERAASLSAPGDQFDFVRVENGVYGDASMHAVIEKVRSALKGERSALGWDVARTGDISAISGNVLRHGRPSHLRIVVAMLNCDFAFMRAVAVAAMDCSPRNTGYGDATGLGMESNETLAKRYRDRWQPHTFSSKGKAEVASAIKTAFSDGTQTLPALDGPWKLVATDLYAVQRDDTTERVVISETDNPLCDESHCDIAYSIGLARLAGARNARIPLPRPLAEKPEGF